LTDAASGGHSLGGAFALLTACAARLRLQLPPANIGCYAFGSPPVLARADKSDPRDVLQVASPLCCSALPKRGTCL
jgi:hypothetical protein